MARPSKIALENNISAAEEQEIQEAFSIFATDNTTITTSHIKSSRIKPKIKPNLTIPIANVRRVLSALSLTPTPDELQEYISILDPDSEGLAEYEPFVAICALKMHSRVLNDQDHQLEVDQAWDLFVNGRKEDRITLDTLRSVAKAIGEEVSDEVLRDMVLEANCGAGLSKGVVKTEFEDVMKRAGVWR